jgi:hypothetical protein
MSHLSLRIAAPHYLPLGIKDSLKEDMRLLLFGFLMGKAFGLRFSGFCFGAFVLEAFCFGDFASGDFALGTSFASSFSFGLLAFWHRRLLEGKKISERKRIAKGKLLKGNC